MPGVTDPTAAFRVLADHATHGTHAHDDAEARITRAMVSLQLLVDGKADQADYDRVAWCVNVGAARAGKIPNAWIAAATFAAAADALVHAMGRKRKFGVYGLTREKLTDLRTGLDLWADLLRSSSPRQMQNAWDEVEAAFRAARKGVKKPE
jgi:NADPH-dependent glutamate synthase beta subunit-like oxidoreductase